MAPVSEPLSTPKASLTSHNSGQQQSVVAIATEASLQQHISPPSSPPNAIAPVSSLEAVSTLLDTNHLLGLPATSSQLAIILFRPFLQFLVVLQKAQLRWAVMMIPCWKPPVASFRRHLRATPTQISRGRCSATTSPLVERPPRRPSPKPIYKLYTRHHLCSCCVVTSLSSYSAFKFAGCEASVCLLRAFS